MHIHTRYSKDSLLCFWPLYLKLKILNIGVVAITDHNTIKGGKKFKEFCLKRGNKIQVIVGSEIFTSQGEIVGLYLHDEIKPGLSARETIYQIKKQGGIVYIPHPYDCKREKTVLEESAIKENREQIDCIEIHNGRNISPEYDIYQREIAKRYNIQPVIGSDAHTWLEIGRNYVICDDIKLDSSEKFRLAIHKFVFRESNCIRVSHQITKVVKLLKLVGKGNFNEIYRIVVRRFKKRKHSGSQKDKN